MYQAPEEITTNDSLTLGQLKKLQKEFTFTYADSDNFYKEIDEFYSYVEISQCLENKKTFEEWFDGSWINSTISERRTCIEYLLETLELKDPAKRFSSARKLLYIAQGTFGELTNPEQQLEWIKENNKLLRNCGALLSYFQALKLACRVHDHYSRPDSTTERQMYMEDVNMEIGFYLTLLYMLTEVHRGDESFGTELADLNPPMTVFLFDLIASLREKEKNAKGYPVKKLLLVLWKVILTSIGELSEIKNLKNVIREINGLPPIQDKELTPKVPNSIQEAGDLYLKFVYISLGTWQCWKEIEEMKKCQIGSSQFQLSPQQCCVSEQQQQQSDSSVVHNDDVNNVNGQQKKNNDNYYKQQIKRNLEREKNEANEEENEVSEKNEGNEKNEVNEENEESEYDDYCWRNFFTAINFLLSHPLLELYALKVLKNQIPFIGRKWRQSNMKIITSIYLNCRPDLRDEWIAPTDADAEVEEALVNAAYLYADDLLLDESFTENWEQWVQDEVYSFSVTRPHLNSGIFGWVNWVNGMGINGPLSSDEIIIYQPTPYQSDQSDQGDQNEDDDD
ncbi:6314_t:CDS:10 [Diversispora eburnea]|uniref:6314_t:CDS:1 n=1 Tax=Diversispora eburnea TaxID=1213867 RepID=A0A9N9BZS7_9GLOM|nr:6314_t:CDS:10 [Diversispora eburnea]